MTNADVAGVYFWFNGWPCIGRAAAIGSSGVQEQVSFWRRARNPCATTVAEEVLSQTVVLLDTPPPQARTQADISVAALLAFQHLGADWDGLGAKEPNLRSIRFAHEFLRKLSTDSRIPTPALYVNGNVLLFVADPDSYGEIESYENCRVGYYICHGGKEWSNEIALRLATAWRMVRKRPHPTVRHARNVRQWRGWPNRTMAVITSEGYCSLRLRTGTRSCKRSGMVRCRDRSH